MKHRGVPYAFNKVHWFRGTVPHRTGYLSIYGTSTSRSLEGLLVRVLIVTLGKSETYKETMKEKSTILPYEYSYCTFTSIRAVLVRVLVPYLCPAPSGQQTAQASQGGLWPWAGLSGGWTAPCLISSRSGRGERRAQMLPLPTVALQYWVRKLKQEVSGRLQVTMSDTLLHRQTSSASVYGS